MKKFIDGTMQRWGLLVVDNPLRVIGADVILSGLLCWLGLWTWAAWAHILLLQNFAFTYVSRARNSGSLSRHMKAAFMSNGVWFLSQVIILSKLIDYLSGKGGIPLLIITCIFYSTFTMAGSLIAHAQALRKESGMEAVGANEKFHQVTTEEWDYVLQRLEGQKFTAEEVAAFGAQKLPREYYRR